jgi:hypothetical protein
MKKVFFNIVQENNKWRLTGQVVDEGFVIMCDTKSEATNRAMEILNAYKYSEGLKEPSLLD